MVDGDLISRSTVIKRLEMISKNCKANKAVSKYIGKQIFDISEKTVDVCIREAKNVPAVDAVPVVRCKDCCWSRTNQKDDADVYYCKLTTGRAYHSGDFCSYGERKDNG